MSETVLRGSLCGFCGLAGLGHPANPHLKIEMWGTQGIDGDRSDVGHPPTVNGWVAWADEFGAMRRAAT
jgi:hypothetical protein